MHTYLSNRDRAKNQAWFDGAVANTDLNGTRSSYQLVTVCDERFAFSGIGDYLLSFLVLARVS